MNKLLAALGATALVGSLAVVAGPSGAADHLDAPLVQTDGRRDINDVYAFRSFQDHDNTVLIMTVNPFAGVVSGTTFDRKATYRLGIDNDGDGEPGDVEIDVTFGRPNRDGVQKVKVKVDGDTVGKGRTNRTIHLEDGGRAWAGLRDDPFFFDLVAFRGTGGRMFCDAGTNDTFAGANVNAIVVEVPSNWLTDDDNPNIAVEARTFGRHDDDGDVADRMGRPAINTVFVAADMKDAFNATEPEDQYDEFHARFEAVLTSLGAADPVGLTKVLLPDLLTLDTSSGAGFLNGRQPANDVIDAELNLITNGGLTTDCVNANDKAFPAGFPYLASPH